VITLELQVAGDVNDFSQGSSARANLEANFRSSLACYDPCLLRLLISSASVSVHVLITVPNSALGASNAPTANLAAAVLAAAVALTSQPAAALSAALAVTVTQAPTITVAENVTAAMVLAPPPPSQVAQPSSGSALDDFLSDLSSIQTAISMQTTIMIIVALVAGVCLLAMAIYFCWVRPGNKSRVQADVTIARPDRSLELQEAGNSHAAPVVSPGHRSRVGPVQDVTNAKPDRGEGGGAAAAAAAWAGAAGAGSLELQKADNPRAAPVVSPGTCGCIGKVVPTSVFPEPVVGRPVAICVPWTLES
jgi:hypothetical protein